MSLMKATAAFGIDAGTRQRDPRLVNAFFWTDVRRPDARSDRAATGSPPATLLHGG